MTIEETVGWVQDTFEGHLFTDDPVDTGGATRHGITQRTYQYWETKYGSGGTITKADVRSLSPERAVQVGVDVFAKETRIDRISDWRVRLLTYDFAFHSGEAAAVKALQRCLGVETDGKIGQKTLTASATQPPFQTALRLLTTREEFLQELIDRKPSQRRYLFGWWKRTTKLQHVIAFS